MEPYHYEGGEVQGLMGGGAGGSVGLKVSNCRKWLAWILPLFGGKRCVCVGGGGGGRCHNNNSIDPIQNPTMVRISVCTSHIWCE